MGIKIDNFRSVGAKIGVLAEGKIDIEINNGKFINNEVAGAVFRTTETANVSLSDIEILGNGEYGIKVEDYDNMIEESIKFAKATKELSEHDLVKLQKLLYQLKCNKNDKPVIRKVIKEILGIGKACIPTILGAVIKYLMG